MPRSRTSALCAKGRAAPEIVYSPDRLLYPLKRTRPKDDPDAGWQRISWDEALDLTAARLRQIADESGPASVTSGLTLEALREAPGGIRVPLETRYRKYADAADGVPRGFATPSGKLELYSETLLAHGYPPVPEYQELRSARDRGRI